MRVFLRLLKKDSIYLMLALFLSVWVVVSFSAFTERLQFMLLGESSQLLAADAILKSPYLLDEELLEQALEFDLRIGRYASFQSMLFAEGEPQLVSVKAVDEGYPLKGLLEVEQQTGQRKLQKGPSKGKVWAEKRLFTLLEIEFGDTVELGEAEFLLDALLLHQPDQGLNLFSVGPRLLMHWDDVESTKLIQQGSKVSYSYLFAGESQAIQAYQQAVKEELSDSQEWVDLHNSQPTVANIVDSAQLFFLLASGAIVILASIAMAMAVQRFAQQHEQIVAVIKSFGLSSKSILWYYIVGLLMYMVPVFLLANGLALLSQDWVLSMLAKQMDAELPALSHKPLILGLLTALISFVAIVGPGLWRLQSSSALMVFRQQNSQLKPSWQALAFAAIALFVLLWLYSGAFFLTALLFISLLLVFVLLLVVFYGLLQQLLKPITQINHWYGLATNQLKRYLPQHAVQAAIFSMSLMLLVMIIGVQDHLFKEWQKQLPENAPNAFLVNIYPDDLKDIEQWLKQQSIETETLYPMVRGRLSKINQVAISELLSKEQQKKASIDRELNLSWKHELAADNVIEQGDWQEPGISIEQQMAERLSIVLGDALSFRIEGQEVTAKVTSIRSVDWNSMRPNFFVLLEQQHLQGFAHTYMTSLHINEQGKREMTTFVQQWPTVILIEIDSLIQQVRTIISYVALALKWVLLFIVFASVLVLFLSVSNSFVQRRHENALLRVFGASKTLLQKSLLAEFALLGLLAGLVATFVAQITLALLQAQIFKLPIILFWELLPVAPVLGLLLIGGAGYLAARRVVNTSTKALLQE